MSGTDEDWLAAVRTRLARLQALRLARGERWTANGAQWKKAPGGVPPGACTIPFAVEGDHPIGAIAMMRRELFSTRTN